MQVMSGREWCTLEEWLQCRRPLCPMLVRHEGRVETSSTANNGLRVCFASRRIGSSFLDDEDGTSQVIYNNGLLNISFFNCNRGYCRGQRFLRPIISIHFTALPYSER